MRILPKNAEKWVLKIDILQLFMDVIIVGLVIAGVFPAYLLLFMVLNGIKGVTIKLG